MLKTIELEHQIIEWHGKAMFEDSCYISVFEQQKKARKDTLVGKN
jgi:hypothetical protein